MSKRLKTSEEQEEYMNTEYYSGVSQMNNSTARFVIVSELNPHLLTVESSSDQNCASLIMSPFHGGLNQQFSITSEGLIIAAHSGKSKEEWDKDAESSSSRLTELPISDGNRTSTTRFASKVLTWHSTLKVV